MEDTFANRLKKILEIRNMKQVELCEKTKLSSGLINKYLKRPYLLKNVELSEEDEAYLDIIKNSNNSNDK